MVSPRTTSYIKLALNAKGTRCSLQLLGVAHMFYRLYWVRGKGSGHHQMQSVMLLAFPPPPPLCLFSPLSPSTQAAETLSLQRIFFALPDSPALI